MSSVLAYSPRQHSVKFGRRYINGDVCVPYASVKCLLQQKDKQRLLRMVQRCENYDKVTKMIAFHRKFDGNHTVYVTLSWFDKVTR